jgi:hypothetical protein
MTSSFHVSIPAIKLATFKKDAVTNPEPKRWIFQKIVEEEEQDGCGSQSMLKLARSASAS